MEIAKSECIIKYAEQQPFHSEQTMQAMMPDEKRNSAKRYVFQFWHTGISSAPPVVQSAIESWRAGCEQAGFEHILIEEKTLPSWEKRIGGEFGDLLEDFRLHAKCWPDAKWRRYSDMLRLALLTRFNGIWADSTVLLTKPFQE